MGHFLQSLLKVSQSPYEVASLLFKAVSDFKNERDQFDFCSVNNFSLLLSELESSSGSQIEEAGSGKFLEEPRPRTTRPWTPLSLYNSDYVALVKERERALVKHDFILENIVSQRISL